MSEAATQQKDFDLSEYEMEDIGVLTVQNIKGTGDLIGADKKNPVTIELFGSGSREAVKALHRAGLAAQRRLRAVFQGRDDPKAAEKAEAEMVEKLVACTKAINNFPVQAEAIYSNPKLGYITKQVVKFLDDDSNFAPGSSTS